MAEELVFKCGTLQESGTKKRMWKSLKQILAVERTWVRDPNLDPKLDPNLDNIVTYSSINAPPSFKPTKKYSDISGLIAPYCDPQTKLYYHNAEEYQTVKKLPMDIFAGYLALRQIKH